MLECGRQKTVSPNVVSKKSYFQIIPDIIFQLKWHSSISPTVISVLMIAPQARKSLWVCCCSPPNLFLSLEMLENKTDLMVSTDSVTQDVISFADCVEHKITVLIVLVRLHNLFKQLIFIRQHDLSKQLIFIRQPE